MASLKRLAFKGARLKPLGFLVGRIFQHAAPLLPLAWRGRNGLAVAFVHPVPYVPFHLLVIPRRRIETVFALAAATNRDALEAVLACAADVLSREPEGRYFLSINGGARQDVMQVHCHITRTGLTCEAAGFDVRPPATTAGWTGTEENARRFDFPLANPGATTTAQIAEGVSAMLDAQSAALHSARGFTVEIPVLCFASGLEWPSALYISAAD